MWSWNRRSHFRTRGTTLVEMLMYCFMLGMMLTSIYLVLLSSLRNYSVYQGMTSITQGASAALGHISYEMVDSASVCVRTDTTPPGVVFLSPRDSSGHIVLSGNNMLWQKYVCYYLTSVGGDSSLLRKEESLAAPLATPSPIPATRSTAYFQSANLPARCLARNVTAFTTSGSNPLQLNLTTSTSPLDKPDLIQVSTQLLLRN